ncbi:MAG: flagellar hook-length control protein FliK, partial [Pseudomonadota bacterium]|nr:flagellar hook-length control protein FliK [Pseudomonadota bacterium]
RKLWNVTMKLDIGSTGAVLAKSKIDNDTITLDLYASNDVILKRLADTLPYLKKRLTELGLTVEQSTFQRGHIPESLNTRPHQIFETRV